jgi:dinuclear metal center YbgI/SA1388 family protein
MTNRIDLQNALDALLQPGTFKDYCPNGLQVEGALEVRKIVSGVTASLALIDAAIAAKADTLIVHHGLFWRGQDGCVTGWMRQRLAKLLANNMNVFAYHLPLDAHPDLGNNAQLGKLLGFQQQGRFGEQMLGMWGVPVDAAFATCEVLASHVEAVLGRSVVCVAGNAGPIRRIAWCSGGAQSYFEAAIAAGADTYITGEISEPQAHLARECGVNYLACGHHATERYGVGAVGQLLAQQFGLEHVFLDVDNPA